MAEVYNSTAEEKKALKAAGASYKDAVNASDATMGMAVAEGAATGAAAGLVAGPVGAAVGALIGAGLGVITGGIQATNDTDSALSQGTQAVTAGAEADTAAAQASANYKAATKVANAAIEPVVIGGSKKAPATRSASSYINTGLYPTEYDAFIAGGA